MRTKLLLLCVLFSSAAFSQDVPYPINYVTSGPYNVVTSATPIDESPTGANVTWDFSNLTAIGSLEIASQEPTTDDLTTYPNTTEVAVITVAGVDQDGKLFTHTSADGTVSITGAVTTDFNANYSTDNATLGTFPMNFGDTYTDTNVAGTYSAQGYEGTFTGTSTTTFDAHGSLTYSDDTGVNFGAPTNVTRLKMVQNLTLDYPPLTDVGTVTQTTNLYFYEGNPLIPGEDGTSSPIFRSTTTVTNIPLLNIDQTDTSLEEYTGAFLGTHHVNATADKIVVAPNPVIDFMNIRTNNLLVRSVTIIDLNGKVVTNAALPGNSVDLSGISSGVYFAKIETSNGISTQKIIKK
jgi:hypothetical protein